MFRSDGDRRSFSLTRDITVIGRREDCDLRIPLGEVSRKHCRLVRDGDSLRLEDLGSSNGTYHNGQRIQEATLRPGDSIQVGPLVFVLQIDGVPADHELQPVQPQELPSAGAGAALEEAEEATTYRGGPSGPPPKPANVEEDLQPLTSLDVLDDAQGGQAVDADEFEVLDAEEITAHDLDASREPGHEAHK